MIGLSLYSSRFAFYFIFSLFQKAGMEMVLLLKKLIYLFLFLPVLGHCCCAQAFSSGGERGLLFVAVSGHLNAVASLIVEHRL